MANRSYLYSADSMPSEADLPPRIRCISQHNWDVPLAHKLMVGHGTTVVPSMIWNPPIGIAAHYAEGAALLLGLLRAVGEGLEDDADFAECVARTTAHLEQQQAKYFILETGEIVSMTSDDPAASVRSLAAEDIPDAVAEAEAAIAGQNDAWLASVRADWQSHFASFYSKALYFSFPE
ncbi:MULTISPECIES: DUF7822 domain-containing protein [Streptomyces]|jgi:hypothetical protein|uniref:DUF7822 domain-containing protein n=2 Tax=Streptomyces TaxID=1883 RepID=A0A514K235_9ACTN|nr:MULTISPECIES: hypothetical protein [Streptomyces]MBA8942412.1 hypothetical protein [Streptomyces calvus]MBA8975654.1 hypothetical protein [Streptomyces calvus]MYS27241.1 hypothetical protein [Streptomyces sp. SID7804]QDI73142.1 hypothetical protein CD934_05895 [Streptomyces calvus]GGP78932.1 hypothetical protein GCM10010247_60380 [Streptomyces calvus]